MNSSSISMMPLQWASLVDIGDVTPLGEPDASLMRDLRDVLRKHGATERFGITLLHKHFDLSDDEVLLESTDEAARTSTVQPVMRNHGHDAIGTCWKFSADLEVAEPLMACQCPWDPLVHRHSGRHER